MRKYLWQTSTVDDNDLEARLNDIEEQDWEILSVVSHSLDTPDTYARYMIVYRKEIEQLKKEGAALK